MTDRLETVTDHLLGRISALELLVAGLLSTTTHRQREIATTYLEIAYAGGLAAQGVSEPFLRGFESTRDSILSIKPQPPVIR